MNDRLIFKSVPAECLCPSDAELSARLKTSRGYTDETIEKCRRQLLTEIDCRYSAVRTGVVYPSENTVDLGFGAFASRSLFKNLSGCKEVFILAVTLGLNVDRLLAKLSVVSPAEHFITDALASAYAEAACDLADSEIKDGLECRPRFSPGYGDLPLEIQPQILVMTDARRLLGITIGKSLLMTPAKSITAIMGIKNE